jgi:hypothetical protein
MANTVQIQAKVGVSGTEGNVTAGRNFTLTPSGTKYLYNVQSVGTAAEALAVNDLGSLRYLGLVNPSTSGATVTVTMAAIVLKPGDSAAFPPASTAVTLQATGAAIDVVAAGSEA